MSGRAQVPAARPARSVALIASGDELVSGACVDTNSAAIARALLDLDWLTRRMHVIGDDEHGLAALVCELCAQHAAVIITGGLGPTLDDVTRHALARAARTELVLSQAVLDALRALFESRGRPFAQSNERQALFPRGAAILENPVGTAPGFVLEIGGAQVFALPGPPREMRVMLDAHVIPRLRALTPVGQACERRSLYLFGLSESAFADQAGDWMARDANPLVGVTAHGGVLSVSVRATGDDARSAAELADTRTSELRERFGAWIFSATHSDPAFALAEQLLARQIRVTTAESCTGGLVAEKLTRVPGISAVFDTGIVAYANATKTRLLGVDAQLLERHGAVSREVAEAMARGAAERSGARCAVSVTGIAGPDGGSDEKPVGLVWFGLCVDGRVTSEERRFVVRGRDLLREFAANTALDLLRRSLPQS